MKKLLLALILGCVSSLASAVSTNIVYSITYTPGVRDAYGSDAAAQTAIYNAFNNIVSAYTANGITLPITAVVTPATGPLSDSSSMASQFVWEQTNQNAWITRSGQDAAAGIIVSAPGFGVPSVVPLNPPLITVDATAAINVADLQNALDDAVSRIAGRKTTSGYSNRARQYPSAGGNICYHTHLAPPSDPAVVYPSLNGWYKSADTDTTSGTPEGACDLDLVKLAAMFGADAYDHRGTLTSSGSGYFCPIYSRTNTLSSTETIVPWTSGSGTVSCSTEYNLSNYSCYGSGCAVFLNGTPIGSPTQNDVQLMNARASLLVNLQSSNGTLLSHAKAGFFSWLLSWLP